jgi:hypothetical protein
MVFVLAYPILCSIMNFLHIILFDTTKLNEVRQQKGCGWDSSLHVCDLLSYDRQREREKV